MFKLRYFTTTNKILVILNSVAATCLKKSWNGSSYESYTEEAKCGQESETLLW